MKMDDKCKTMILLFKKKKFYYTTEKQQIIINESASFSEMFHTPDGVSGQRKNDRSRT